MKSRIERRYNMLHPELYLQDDEALEELYRYLEDQEVRSYEEMEMLLKEALELGEIEHPLYPERTERGEKKGDGA